LHYVFVIYLSYIFSEALTLIADGQSNFIVHSSYYGMKTIVTPQIQHTCKLLKKCTEKYISETLTLIVDGQGNFIAHGSYYSLI